MNTDNIRDLINGETAEACLDRLLGWYEREVSRQYDSRLERAKDADFFDGEQFDAKNGAGFLEAFGDFVVVFRRRGVAGRMIMYSDNGRAVGLHRRAKNFPRMHQTRVENADADGVGADEPVFGV